jgi:hypothetical protein
LRWAHVDAYVSSNISPTLQHGSLEEFATCAERINREPVAFASVQEICEAIYFIQRMVKSNGFDGTPKADTDFALLLFVELRQRLRSAASLTPARS